MRKLFKQFAGIVLAVVVLATTFSTPAQAVTSSKDDDKSVINCIVAPCEIAEIKSPAKGDTWQAGSTNTIIWKNYSEYGSAVYINLVSAEAQLAVDSDVAIPISKGPVKNNGSHKWTIPAKLDSLFVNKKVAVSLYFPEIGQTVVSNAFTISESATEKPMTVTSPKAGSVYGYNSKEIVPIRWKSSSRSTFSQARKSVSITLTPVSSCNGDMICPAIALLPYTIAEEARNTGSYNWEVPKNLGAAYLDTEVQITVTVISTGQSATSEPFKIQSWPTGNSDSITVTSPKLGDTYSLKQTMPITWKSSTNNDNVRASMVRISLVPSPACLDAEPVCAIKSVAPYVIVNKTHNDGEYKWRIPNRLKQFYYGEMKVLVEELNTSNFGTSARFTIGDSSTSSLAIATESMPNGSANQNYEHYFTATGGTAPYSWSASITQSRVTYSMNEKTGRFFASPTTPGLWRVNVTVTDSAGKTTSKLFPWTVNGQPVNQNKAGTLILGSETDPTSVFLIVEKEGTLGRMAFPNEAVFMSHGYKWNKLVPSSLEDQQLPVVGSFKFAPGSLIKQTDGLQSARAIYLVVDENTIRPFANYQAFVAMGYTASMVWNINSNFLTSYTTGDPIRQAERHPDGTDVIDGTKVYYINNGQLREYENLSAVNSWHTFDNDFSKVVPISTLDKQLPLGKPIGIRYYPN